MIDAGQREHVERVVELAVAAAIQAVAVGTSGGDGNRCASGEASALRVCLQALGAADLADQRKSQIDDHAGVLVAFCLLTPSFVGHRGYVVRAFRMAVSQAVAGWAMRSAGVFVRAW